MRTDGGNLELGVQGDDVRSLHVDLLLLGYQVPDAEGVEGLLGEGTRAAVVAFQVRNRLGDSGIVDDRTAQAITTAADPLRPRVVSGTVRYTDPDNSPAPGIRVAAVDMDLRSETVLGEAVTGIGGGYEITYTAEQFRRAEKGGADLVMRALGSVEPGAAEPTVADPDATVPLRLARLDSTPTVLAASPILFNAGPIATVDLLVPGVDDGLSEFDRYLADVVLVLDGLSQLDLHDGDMAFLAGETGIPRERIVWLVAAVRAEGDMAMPSPVGPRPGDGPLIPAGAFYAWFRKGLPSDRAALFARPVDELIGVVKDAVVGRIAPRSLVDQLDRLAEVIRVGRLDHVLRPAPEGAPATLGDLLASMRSPLDPERRRAVAEVAGEVSPSDEQFAVRLEKAGLSAGQVAEVKTTLRLGDLTLRHAPMVNRLQDIAGQEANGTLRPLSTLRPDQWLDLAYDSGPPALSGPDGSKLDEAGYARLLRERVEELHPTATLGARLADGSLPLDLPGAAELPGFLRGHPDFDILDADIPAFIGNLDPGSLAVDPDALTSSLQAIQRVKTLGTTWQETAALVNAGRHSHLGLVEVGLRQLQDELHEQIDPARVTQLQVQAYAAHDLTLTAMSNALSRFEPATVAALPQPRVDTAPLAGNPTLQSLFGALDTCACGHCRSVLGPAAYLVDLLRFLQGSGTALPVLLARRPDLVDLDLSCENAEQEIPCVDLAVEILENAVALPLKVVFPPGTHIAAELAKPALSPVIREVLDRTVTYLGEDLRARKEPDAGWYQTLDHWTVTDRHRRWALTHQPEAVLVRTPVKGGVKTTRLDGLDTAKLVAELRLGRLTAEAENRLGELLLTPVEQLLGAEFVVETLEAGRRWTVRGMVKGGVRIAGGLELTGRDGNPVTSRQYSARALTATATALAESRTGGLLTEQFPASKGYEVEQSTATDRWTIQRPMVTIELDYVPDSLSVAALAYQSSRDGAELLAYPENRNRAAYSRLGAAVFPWTLPFDLALTETRALLDRAGTSRLRLMEALNPNGLITDADIAYERLGLSLDEVVRITTTATATPSGTDPSLWDIWGLHLDNGETTVVDASSGDTVSGKPLPVLRRVSILLQQARLSHGELLDVLATRFVRGAGQPLALTPRGTCKPSEMHLEALDEADLDRIHRFVRLWRKLGWRADELDLALAALNSENAITATTLTGLAQIQRLREVLGVDIDELASWWAGFATPVYRAHTVADEPEIKPLYERLFARLSLRNPPDTDFALNAARTELAIVGSGEPIKTISGKLPAIAAAFGVRETQLRLFFDALLSAGMPDELRLDHLSTLHRVVSIARAMGIPAADCVRLRELTGLKSFGSPAAVVGFHEAVEFVRRSGFTIEELTYLLRHEQTPGLAAALSDTRAASVMAEVRDAVLLAGVELADPGVPPAALLRTCLTRLQWDSALIEELLVDLRGTAEVALPPDAKLLAGIAIPASLKNLVRLDGDRLATLDLLPATAYDPAAPDSLYSAFDAADQLYPAWTAAIERLALTVSASSTRLVDHLQTAQLFSPEAAGNLVDRSADADARVRAVLARAVRLAQSEAPVLPLAQALAADPDVVRELLLHRLSAVGVPGSAIAAFLDPKLLDSDRKRPPARADCPEAFATLLKLHKATLLLTRLGVDGARLRWLAGRGVVGGMSALDLDTLPTAKLAAVADTAGTFADWRQLIMLYQLRDRAPGMAELTARYVTALGTGTVGSQAACRQELADGLDVPVALVVDAASRIGPALDPDPGPMLAYLRSPASLARLVDLVLTLKRVGATVAQADVLTTPAADPGSFDSAAVARSLLRSRFGAANWLEALKPVSDELRQRQRDALVDYLVATDQLGGAEDIYERYLIDVLMGPRLRTSRLVQAISAVHLFVDRCLLHLEDHASPDAIDRTRWEWIKNYRVWEANRKVFLYPENWLLPELREDQTEIFRDLGGSLNQGEPSSATSSNALLVYLDQLAELAQVTVLGMYHHVPVADPTRPGAPRPSVLYVVGRSPNEPYRYFWRSCEQFGEPGMRWTGWEQIDADLSGTHLIPFVFDGDFHIAWPLVRKEQAATGTAEWWEVRLAWTRHTTQGWRQKKVSDGAPLKANVVARKDERSSFMFRTEAFQAAGPAGATGQPNTPAGQRLVIHCYAAQVPNTANAIAPRNMSTIHSHASFVGLSISGVAYVNIGKEGGPVKWDYARGAKVTLTVEPLPGDKDDSWVGEVRDFLKLPRTSPTGDSGQFSDYFATSDKSLGNRLLSVKYVLTVEFAGMTPQTDSITLNAKNSSCFWFPDIQFGKPSGPDAPSEPESRFEGVGRFVFGSGQDVRFEVGAVQEPIEITDTVNYDNGYLERSQRNGKDDLVLTASRPSLSFDKTPGRFMMVPAGPGGDLIWHYEDQLSKYFLRLPSVVAATAHLWGGVDGGPVQPPRGSTDDRWLGISDGHPHAAYLLALAGADLEALYTPKIQAITDNGTTLKERNQPAQDPAAASFVEQGISFDPRAAYSLYNWELFLHAPLLIADHLSKQQRFEEARQWLHRVFDPTIQEAAGDPSRYWRCLPLRVAGRGVDIQQLIAWLADPSVNRAEKAGLQYQIEMWKAHPFRPHEVARLRHRAYQWQVVYAYLDNLLDWGDQLFRRDTREALDEAALRYILAAKLLGPRPQSVAARAQAPTLTFRTVTTRWDEFSNTWFKLSDQPALKPGPHLSSVGKEPVTPNGATSVLTSLGVTYFCMPHNEKLIEYWDRVEDRLFKIRHCQNIDGIARDLPLFASPIDPALLVRAVAEGVPLDEVLAGQQAPLPHYRFNILAQKANELCAELKSLGAAVLSALEKKDAERLSQLRAGQEAELLNMVTQIKRDQITEAQENLNALGKSRDIAVAKYSHYQYLLGRGDGLVPGGEERPSLHFAPSTGLAEDERGFGLLQSEWNQLIRQNEAQVFGLASGGASVAAGLLHALAAIPAYALWAEPWGRATDSTATALKAMSDYAGHWATRDATLAGYQRRKDDWVFQSNSTLRELAQIDKQIAAATLRVAITTHELDNHFKQIDHARTVNEFLRDKYTSEQLYSWMTGQISTVFFSTYQVALDAARRAERALRFELGLQESHYIRPAYWDTLKSGLFAGERLWHDLKRMELAYLEHSGREYELTKHISLRQLDPLALIRLKETGTCDISLPEALFDLDCPAYLRRIKTISLSIPCVTGPYTSVNCRLTLLKSRVRHTGTLNGGYKHQPDDKRFRDDHGLIQSMVTSTAVNDSGLFETNLRDERYLWFEGAGAISEWRLELPTEFRQFNHDTIADVVLHLRYTAREGGQQLRSAAVATLTSSFKEATTTQPLARLISLRHEYPSEWAKLTAATPSQRTVTIEVGADSFPYLFQNKAITVTKVDVLASAKDLAAAGLPNVTAPHVGDETGELELKEAAAIGDLLHKSSAVNIAIDAAASSWALAGGKELAALRDLLVVLTYTVT